MLDICIRYFITHADTGYLTASTPERDRETGSCQPSPGRARGSARPFDAVPRAAPYKPENVRIPLPQVKTDPQAIKQGSDTEEGAGGDLEKARKAFSREPGHFLDKHGPCEARKCNELLSRWLQVTGTDHTALLWIWPGG